MVLKSTCTKIAPPLRNLPAALKQSRKSGIISQQNAFLANRTRPFSSTPSAAASGNGTTPGKLTLPYKIESPLAPLGVAAAVSVKEGKNTKVERKIFKEFTLTDRVALVSGANHGLGLEMAMALGEAGARVVYCIDLHDKPSDEWVATRDYLKKLGGTKEINGNADSYARLEYVSADVRDQAKIWKIGEEIGDKEGRLDICVAAAGVPSSHTDCLEYPDTELKKVMDVNVNGVLFTAQAAGRQMRRFGKPGSIVLIASMSGSITNKGHKWVSYNSSKAAVIQMARNMACELGADGIRVNSLSPGYIYTNMSAAELNTKPQLLDRWSELTPINRIGRPDELRGVVTWLASDASSFCTGSDIIVAGGHQSW